MSGEQTNIKKVILASSAGTMIEWYDFYIFGSLATILSTKFFPQDNPTAAFLSTLATFAAGFVVRPFGALFFGRLGDLIGRKYTFMVTLLLMGGATFLIGCVPGYETIGFLAPVLVLILRLLQGLALGGEYGGAATYVAEHAEPDRRGYWTSWIQTTATLGLFVSLLVILITKLTLGNEVFNDWGWRIPFWVSILMVALSFVIRRKMKESPLFSKAKADGKISANPLKESFGNSYNFKYVLLALLGATMGQGVIWYTGHYYAMNFLKGDCKIDGMQVEEMMVIAFVLGTPFFVLFGWLSDKIGRKNIMLAGMLIAVLSYFPIYKAMYNKAAFDESTELIEQKKEKEIQDKVVYERYFADGTKVLEIHSNSNQSEKKIEKTIFVNQSDFWSLVMLIFIQVVFVTMVYGPIAAFLVEMFPTKIRYTSMSLPYHIGNGVFGGLMPAVAAYLTTTSKGYDEEWYLQGIWYPVIIASICFVIGLFYIDGTDKRVDD